MAAIRRAVVCGTVLALLLGGWAGATQAAPARDTIVIGMAQEPDILGPFSIMAAAGVIHNPLWGFIAPYTDRWVRMPVMAEKLPTIKDGDWQVLPTKKMRVTWRLKRGFTWHDGRPVTALDWRFTYGFLRNPRVPHRYSRFIVNKVDNVLVPTPNDPYTLVVQWNELWPFANADPFGIQYALPRHVLERDYLRDPTRMQAHPYFRAPVANGPYRFVEWAPGSHIALEAYERWPLGAPRVRRLIFRFILDSTVLTANQIAGTVDATEINNFGIEQMVEIERRNPRVATHYTEALIWERIDFNLDHEWLRDKRVRQALAYAIDREGIVRALFQGKQPVAHSWLAPKHPAYNPNVKKYPYDVARARALLAEAGFTPGPDGILRDRAGRRVELTIMTTAGNAPREQVQQIMKEQLRQVGIDLRIDNRPASVFFGSVVPRRQFPHLAMYASLFTPDSTAFDRFHSSQIPSEQNNWEGNNRVGWRNLENDRLMEQIINELDEGRRNALFKRHQELFAEELPSLPLYFRLSLTTMRRDVRNVRPTGLGTYYLPWNSWQWEF
ncbi:MAG: peptide ABC transporter substrate-binding protein [Armatimonadota bacterium]|nr:peptide ABC transporter substrate-binding protein [Armatimonadota bacterium]MDR7448100.1 peptide ABC transporter substrate-binding protein [Armatimonadota bacterium]MDR7459696.1 peptide ABC transporter substrate-binding protein [Armatimonadota bacterium]MDR7478288.1 peptide ABC transporter substrate-binding protein [Armatimonadota bacterium]MDR7487269.1 peptide ABC transporter substrate-binding protein [Armatimonadota bacterium]